MAGKAEITFDVVPQVTYDYLYGKAAEIEYRITIPKSGHAICTGWRYPIDNVDPAEWPERTSCRTAETRTIVETWGGSAHPLPYIGRYIAFVDSYHNGIRMEAISSFKIVEGLSQ
jgi:hypothetical protein